MNNQASAIILSKEALRIVLLRVVPGHAREVFNNLRAIMNQEIKKNNPNILEYKFYKILGLYDVMLIYRCREFSNDLLLKGTFEHVMHSNEILCYHLLTGDSQPFFKLEDLEKGLFVSLIKLRIEPLIQFGLDFQTIVADYMKSIDNLFVLGGLGWNEFLLVRPHNFNENELEEIFNKNIQNFSTLYFENEDTSQDEPIVHKTYSFWGVSYDCLDNLVAEFPAKFGEPANGLCPSLFISTTAHDFYKILTELSTFFPKEENHFDYDTQIMTGVHDINLSFKQGFWGELLKGVIDFRESDPHGLLDTRIMISLKKDESSLSPQQLTWAPETIKFPLLEITEDDVNKIMQRSTTSHLVSTIYRFANFLNDPLIRDGFLDLYIPANKLIELAIAKNDKDNWSMDDRPLNEMVYQFQFAMRERAMGTYLFTEQDEHLFSPIKGGLQRILLALASIPHSLLKAIIDNKYPWQGYVSIGLKSEPMHFYENLHLPFEYALLPEKYWWVLIHEIGHILSLKWMIFNIEEQPIMRNTIDRIPTKDLEANVSSFRNLADNCFADLFDFLIGFLGDRSLYFRVTWDFLGSHIPRQEFPFKTLNRHMTRQFVGWLYEKIFLQKKFPYDKIDDQNFRKSEAELFIKGVNKDYGMDKLFQKCNVTPFDITDYLSLESRLYLSLLPLFEKFLRPVLSLLTELKEEASSKHFQKTIKQIINNGQVVSPDDIKFPHLIILKLLDMTYKEGVRKDIDFSVRLATILSLSWYSYKNLLPTTFEAAEEAKLGQV